MNKEYSNLINDCIFEFSYNRNLLEEWFRRKIIKSILFMLNWIKVFREIDESVVC